MVTPQEFAALLNGREYGDEITKEEAALAEAHGLVVVFGYSDDCMELRGAIKGAVACYDGGTEYITSKGLLENECDCHDCPYFQKAKSQAKKLTAVWGEDDYSWIYQTDIPHATFEIVEDGDPYCRGIVFSLADVG